MRERERERESLREEEREIKGMVIYTERWRK